MSEPDGEPTVIEPTDVDLTDIEPANGGLADTDIDPLADTDIDPLADTDIDPTDIEQADIEQADIAQADIAQAGVEPADAKEESFGAADSRDIDRQTLLWAMAGDDRAFARLVQHYDLSLRALVYPQVGQTALMDKVLASTYLQAYRALPRLKGAPDPGPWLSAIAAKACAAELRRQTQRNRVARRRDSPQPPPGARSVDLVPGLGPARSDGPDRADRAVPTLRPKPARPVAERRAPTTSLPTPPSPGEAGAPESDMDEPSHDNHAGPIGTPTGAPFVDRDRRSPHDPQPDDPPPHDPPPHDHEFWNRLGRRLLAEREIPARPALPVEQFASVRRQVRDAAGAGPEDGNGRGSPPSPDTVEELAQRAGGAARGHRAGLVIRRVLVIVVVLGALGAVVYLAFRIGGNARPINRSAMTTGRLADKVTATLDQSQFVSGTFTHIELASPQSITSFRLTWSRDGSFRLQGINAPIDTSYDAANGSSRQSTTTIGPDGMTAKQVETTGLAGGPPDAHAATDPFFDHDLPAVLRTMQSVPNGPVTTSTVQGRPVWQADVELGSPGAGERARLRIDQQLLLPVELTVTTNGRPLRTYTLGDISLDQPPSLDAFTVPFGTGPVDRVDERFVRTTLNDIGAVVPGSRPATPTSLPDGYVLAEVAVHPGQGGRTGAEGRNPPDDNVVSLTYRRGWDRVTVTTRTNTASPGQRWSDPFARSGPAPVADTVRINGGRFRLVNAQRARPADGVPYLWGVSSDVVFTVSGNLSPDKLVKVTESIEP